jgi:hypothetical protein
LTEPSESETRRLSAPISVARNNARTRNRVGSFSHRFLTSNVNCGRDKFNGWHGEGADLCVSAHEAVEPPCGMDSSESFVTVPRMADND